MKKEDCFYLGQIIKKYSYKGEVIIKLDTDEPQRYKGLDGVFVETKGQLSPLFIERINLNGEFMRVKFEDINDETQAETLLRKEVYLPLSLLPELNEDQFYYHDIIGYKVIDNLHGEIGILEKVNDNTAQTIFEINHEEKTILVPAVDEFIDHVDKKNRTIYLKMPSGLLELYL